MQKIEMEEANKVSGRSVCVYQNATTSWFYNIPFSDEWLRQLCFTFNVHSCEIATKQTLLIWKAALDALLKTTEIFLNLDFRKKEKNHFRHVKFRSPKQNDY